MQRMPYLYRSFSAKEPYDSWLFCGKQPVQLKASRASSPPCSELMIQGGEDAEDALSGATNYRAFWREETSKATLIQGGEDA